MYSRALATRPYGCGNQVIGPKVGQLPYQAQADPTVNRKSTKKKRSSSRSSRNSQREPLTCDRKFSGGASLSQGNNSNPCTQNEMSIGSGRTSTYDDDSLLQHQHKLLTMHVINGVERIFHDIARKEKIRKGELIALFYVNHGEVEAWYIYDRSSDTHLDCTNSLQRSYKSSSQRLQLTQRRQNIFRQYYHYSYQYVILYRDRSDAEFYRCVGVDGARKRADIEAKQQRNGSKGFIWTRIFRSIRSMLTS